MNWCGSTQPVSATAYLLYTSAVFSVLSSLARPREVVIRRSRFAASHTQSNMFFSRGDGDRAWSLDSALRLLSITAVSSPPAAIGSKPSRSRSHAGTFSSDGRFENHENDSIILFISIFSFQVKNVHFDIDNDLRTWIFIIYIIIY